MLAMISSIQQDPNRPVEKFDYCIRKIDTHLVVE